MRFYLVDVKDIVSDVPRSNFDEAELETIAELIIESGGLIKPLVLKQSGAETYAVVEGHLEYYAAVRAKEKNPRQCEMVNAFVISPKIEDLVLKQVTAITGVGDGNKPPIIEPVITNIETSRLNNLELRLEKVISELKSEIAQERQRVDDKFKEVNSNTPKPGEEVSQPNDPLQLLNTLTQQQLVARLRSSRITSYEKKAKAIVEARNKKQNQKFEDYRDVKSSVTGLGEMGILTIIDEWSRN
ncbi:chromosome partitioning protein ParB [Anabaena sp. UHCC 0451]|uniref:chromosome partitioning protein ParB n=1 Tax=Anabaena sp. UHCC 0451 TaxID=2055235 RepID=UPI002B2049CA|nr:chromosome partitioning protein ParB [Anabaena sp. UHCC 0451]MEA5575629.1 chromosome partitioning protein ParB [Anabaena sp. UHCC 0451]